MRKIAYVVICLVLLVGCSKSSVSTGKLVGFAAKTFAYEEDGVQYSLDTSISNKSIPASKVPADGLVSKAAILVDDCEFIDALVVTQTLERSPNYWDPSVYDYHLNVDFEIVSSDYRIVEMDGYYHLGLLVEDKDKIVPAQIRGIKVTSIEAVGKCYDQNEVPMDCYKVHFQIYDSDGIVDADRFDGNYSVYVFDYSKYADEEAQRPFLYDNIKLRKNGTLAFLDGNEKDYLIDNGGEMRSVRVYNPNSYGGFDIEVHYFRDTYVTLKGYDLLDAIIDLVFIDEFKDSSHYGVLNAMVTDELAGTLLYHFIYDRRLDDAMDSFETELYYRNMVIYGLEDYIDYETLSAFRSNVSRMSTLFVTEENYKRMYGL